jgi:hypothetical protein
MKLLKIYDGRTLGELMNGREFFTRANFEASDGTLYGGWKDGPRHRFFTIDYTHANTRLKQRLIRKNSKLDKQMLALMIEHESDALRWRNKDK